MVESIDDSVGRVMNTLEKLKLTLNTIIIFTSDNGGFWKATHHAPLRANKGAYYEGGIRVPLIIKWPGMAKTGLAVDEPVISNDLYPTCLAACGLPALPNHHVDGLDLSELLQGNATGLNRQSLFWHFQHYNEHPFSVPSSVVRKGPWKLIETFDPTGFELYNLDEVISESNNLADSDPEKLAELRMELAVWRTEVGAEMMRPNPNYDSTSKDKPKKRER